MKIVEKTVTMTPTIANAIANILVVPCKNQAALTAAKARAEKGGGEYKGATVCEQPWCKARQALAYAIAGQEAPGSTQTKDPGQESK